MNAASAAAAFGEVRIKRRWRLWKSFGYAILQFIISWLIEVTHIFSKNKIA